MSPFKVGIEVKVPKSCRKDLVLYSARAAVIFTVAIICYRIFAVPDVPFFI